VDPPLSPHPPGSTPRVVAEGVTVAGHPFVVLDATRVPTRRVGITPGR
jgi:hypothetical protein